MLWTIAVVLAVLWLLGGMGLAGTLLLGGWAFEFAPEPYRGSNNGNPEQKTKHDGRFLDKECASLAKDVAGAQRNNACA